MKQLVKMLGTKLEVNKFKMPLELSFVENCNCLLLQVLSVPLNHTKTKPNEQAIIYWFEKHNHVTDKCNFRVKKILYTL